MCGDGALAASQRWLRRCARESLRAAAAKFVLFAQIHVRQTHSVDCPFARPDSAHGYFPSFDLNWPRRSLGRDSDFPPYIDENYYVEENLYT